MHNKILKIILLVLIPIILISSACFMILRHGISLNGDEVIYISLNDTYRESGAKVNFGNEHIKITGTVDNSKIGDYKIKYESDFLGIPINKYRTVKVVDREAPTIELSKGDTVNICKDEEYVEDGYKAVDNYDGDLTDKVQREEKEGSVFYTVEDSSHNKTTVRRYLNREDHEAPELKLKGNDVLTLFLGGKYVDPGYEVSDNCTKEVRVETKGEVDTNKIGTYEVVYTATDDENNVVTAKRYVKVVSHTNSRGIIYLTFDDGPSASSTPTILDILKKKNIKATFFVINHDSSLDYLIKREHDEGHTVALHSYSHNYQKIYSSKDAFYNDLSLISNKVERITGTKSMITRFPGGSSNTISKKYKIGIMSELTKEMRSKGYHYFDWNVDSDDAGGARDSNAVYNNVVGSLSKNRANVVLMHDFNNNKKTVNALERIIDYGVANGYIFDKIDMTTNMVTHGVNN